MQITFEYHKPDVIDALRFHFLHRGEIRVFRIALLILLAFAVGGYFAGVVSPQAVAAIVIMMMLLVIVFWYILPFSTYKRATTFKEHIRLQYDEEGMTIGTHIGERAIAWRKFSQVVETNAFFFLYRDKKSFFLIPVNAFTAEAKEAFRTLLKSKFDNYRKK